MSNLIASEKVKNGDTLHLGRVAGRLVHSPLRPLAAHRTSHRDRPPPPLHPLGWHLNREWITQERISETRPGPVDRMRN